MITEYVFELGYPYPFACELRPLNNSATDQVHGHIEILTRKYRLESQRLNLGNARVEVPKEFDRSLLNFDTGPIRFKQFSKFSSSLNKEFPYFMPAPSSRHCPSRIRVVDLRNGPGFRQLWGSRSCISLNCAGDEKSREASDKLPHKKTRNKDKQEERI